MAKYRKKPVVIEARQFDGTDESVEWLLPQLKSGEIGRATNKLYIKTLEGVMTANKGDYIIKGVNGEFYPCKPDIFEQTYELAYKEAVETAKAVVDTINKMQKQTLACSSVLNI